MEAVEITKKANLSAILLRLGQKDMKKAEPKTPAL
jgi:hypothetical protein